MKISSFLLLVILVLGLASLTAVSAADNATGQLVASYGDGKLYKYGSTYVVELHGSYREMGQQYGALRNDTLHDLYSQLSENPVWLSFLNMGDLNTAVALYSQRYSQYPQYNEVMMGISETSGLGNKTYITNTIIKEVYVMYMRQLSSQKQCSFDAAWGPYTANTVNKSLVAGRNYDLGQVMTNYTEIVVYNPDDGSIPVAVIGWTGSVYITSGLNKEGVFLELNDGTGPEKKIKIKDLMSSENFLQYENTSMTIQSTSSRDTDTNLELFKLLQTSANMDEIKSNFANISTTSGTIINVADKNEANSFEWISYKYAVRVPQDDGLLVATNHFIDPSWGLKQAEPGSKEDSGESALRMSNILNLSNQNKGNITPEVMMQIMETPIPDGGPLFPGITSYEIVVVPADLKVWLKAPAYYNWTEVDLKNHFT